MNFYEDETGKIIKIYSPSPYELSLQIDNKTYLFYDYSVSFSSRYISISGYIRNQGNNYEHKRIDIVPNKPRKKKR